MLLLLVKVLSMVMLKTVIGGLIIKKIRGGARPRDIYLNYCDDILIQGVTVCNTACWTIHPYYSDNVKLINLKVRNPKISPNTDGCDPESVYNL